MIRSAPRPFGPVLIAVYFRLLSSPPASLPYLCLALVHTVLLLFSSPFNCLDLKPSLPSIHKLGTTYYAGLTRCCSVAVQSFSWVVPTLKLGIGLM